MNAKSLKNKRGIRIRRISGNRSEDSLLDSESDEDLIVFPRRRINIIDSDEEFSTQSSSDEENSGPQRIVWQPTSQTNNNSYNRPWKGNCPYVPEAPHSPVTYFRKLFDTEIISNIVDYTNMYAVQCDPTKPIDVSVNEIEQFFGCCFFMSIYGLPRSEMYWSSETRVSAVADTMSRTRWKEIKSKIHFSRNLQDNTNNSEVTDSLQKIRPILDKLLKNFNRIPMSEHVCVDEQIIPFKGRHRLKQYMPKKPKKWGYKVFLLCDSSGLIYNFEIYTGKVVHDHELPNVGSSGNVVLRLSRIIPKQLFHKICFDNWFSTVRLVTELEKLGIQSVATVRSNRLKDCEFSSDKVMKTKGRGSYELLSTSIDRVTINAVKWYDNKAVHLMSTFCEIEPIDIVKRWDKKMKKVIDVQRPNVVKMYNQHMGGVDVVDSLIALYRIKIRSRKWYHRIMFHLLDLTVVNAWLLYISETVHRILITPDVTDRVIKDWVSCLKTCADNNSHHLSDIVFHS
ncbi:PiggyBac transposable element-derived protein 3 [Anthophora plagiata]